MDAVEKPSATRCSVTLLDGTELSARTLPQLARVYAMTVLGDDEWAELSPVEQAGASSAMFNELLRLFGVVSTDLDRWRSYVGSRVRVVLDDRDAVAVVGTLVSLSADGEAVIETAEGRRSCWPVLECEPC